MRLKGFIFTVDGVIALAFLIAASLTVITFYHAAPEQNKYADVQQLGFDYLTTSGATLPDVLDATGSDLASVPSYAQSTICVYLDGPDFNNPALDTDPGLAGQCKFYRGVKIK